jgi:hypothetical protein
VHGRSVLLAFTSQRFDIRCHSSANFQPRRKPLALRVAEGGRPMLRQTRGAARHSFLGGYLSVILPRGVVPLTTCRSLRQSRRLSGRVTASSRLAAPERRTKSSHNCFLNASLLPLLQILTDPRIRGVLLNLPIGHLSIAPARIFDLKSNISGGGPSFSPPLQMS